MSMHPSAIVEPGAKLGARVSIGPFAFIGPDVEVGDDCTIGPHAVLLPGTALGPGCRVHSHAVLGDLPQDLAFKGQPSGVRIGPGCVVREGVTIHRGTKPDTFTETGKDCFLMANCHLGHNARLGDNVILANGVLLGGYAQVGDRAFISGNVAIHQFVRVGRLAMVGGGGAHSRDVPPFCTVPGVSLNCVRGVNVVGLRRAGMTPAQRMEVRHAFRVLYRSGLNVTQALAAIRQDPACGELARELADFVQSSKRGVCRFGGRRDRAADDGDDA